MCEDGIVTSTNTHSHSLCPSVLLSYLHSLRVYTSTKHSLIIFLTIWVSEVDSDHLSVVKVIEGLSSHKFGLHNGVLVPNGVYLK